MPHVLAVDILKGLGLCILIVGWACSVVMACEHKAARVIAWAPIVAVASYLLALVCQALYVVGVHLLGMAT